MNTIVNLFLISVVVCFIIDCSGFISSIKSFIIDNIMGKRHIKPSDIRIKPIDCSLCMVWWTGFCYLAFTNALTLVNVVALSILSLISSNISGLMFYIKDLLAKIEEILYKIIK